MLDTIRNEVSVLNKQMAQLITIYKALPENAILTLTNDGEPLISMGIKKGEIGEIVRLLARVTKDELMAKVDEIAALPD